MLTEVLTVSVFAATPIYTTDNQGTVNYDVNSGSYTASYSGELQADQHLLLVVRKAA